MSRVGLQASYQATQLINCTNNHTPATQEITRLYSKMHPTSDQQCSKQFKLQNEDLTLTVINTLVK